MRKTLLFLVLTVSGAALLYAQEPARFERGLEIIRGNLHLGGTSGNRVCFEGATADAFETCLGAADVTADVVFTLPLAGGADAAFVVSALTTNSVDVVNSIWGVSNGLRFEGATANAHELTLSPTDVGGDITLTLPGLGNADGAILASTLTTNDVGAANSVWGASNALVFEGATADTSEITLSPADATADATVTIPGLTGTLPIMAMVAAGGTETVAAVSHAGGCVALDTAGGSVVTLPAATGTGNRYCFVVTATSASHQINVVGNDEFVGGVFQGNDSDNTTVFWPAADGGDNDRIEPNGTSRGGVVGAIYIIVDVATDNWQVFGFSDASGTEATPFATGTAS